MSLENECAVFLVIQLSHLFAAAVYNHGSGICSSSLSEIAFISL